MAQHGKKHPGPKNYTKKYKTKKHNPVPGAVINVNRRRSGAPPLSEADKGGTALGGVPVGRIRKPGPGQESHRPPTFNPRVIWLGEQPASVGRRVGRNLTPGTPRRVGRASVGRLRGGMFGRASARRRVLRKKKRGLGF